MISQSLTSQHYLDTGQRTCHADDGSEIPCEGSDQDASFAVGTPWAEPRFEERDDEVMDRLTGLNWCRSANLAEFPLTWQEALDFVATMNRDQRFDQRDWRMYRRVSPHEGILRKRPRLWMETSLRPECQDAN